MAAPALVRGGGGDEATGRSLSHFGRAADFCRKAALAETAQLFTALHG
jgi:hypothetical protein